MDQSKYINPFSNHYAKGTKCFQFNITIKVIVALWMGWEVCNTPRFNKLLINFFKNILFYYFKYFGQNVKKNVMDYSFINKRYQRGKK